MPMAELAGTWTLRNFNPTFVTGNETPQENAFIAGALDLRLDRAADPLYAAGMAADPFYLVGTIGWPGNPPGVLDVMSRVDRHPTLVGSVIRAKPHASSGGRTSAAGEIFSFIAVKPQQADM